MPFSAVGDKADGLGLVGRDMRAAGRSRAIIDQDVFRDVDKCAPDSKVHEIGGHPRSRAGELAKPCPCGLWRQAEAASALGSDHT